MAQQLFELTKDYVVLVFEIYRPDEPASLFGVFDSIATAMKAVECSPFHSDIEYNKDGIILARNWWGGRVHMALQPARVQTETTLMLHKDMTNLKNH